ncbi:MAG: EthD family reductase [bacterium]
MIKVSFFYANEPDKKFDVDYFVNKHMAMVGSKLGSALKGMSAEQGLGGGEPGAPATYVAMGHLLFDSVEAFQQAIAPHLAEITADIANYTDIAPIMQVSEVKI